MIVRIPWGVQTILPGVQLITRGAVDILSNPTLAAGDFKLSTNVTPTYTNLGTTPTLDPSSDTSVKITISASEAECTSGIVRGIDSATKQWEDVAIAFTTPLFDGATCGKITSGSPTTTSFISSQLTGANTDQYKDAWVAFLTGTCAGAVKKITAFNASTDTVTCDALPAAPSVGDVFILVNGV